MVQGMVEVAACFLEKTALLSLVAALLDCFEAGSATTHNTEQAFLGFGSAPTAVAVAITPFF